MASPVNSTYVRKTNRQKVLKQIRSSAGISRQELAERIGLTPPAISGIVRDWLTKKVLKEEGYAESGGGRRPVRLVLDGNAALVIGAELSRQQIRISITDLKGEILSQQEWNLDMSDPYVGIHEFGKKLNDFLRNSQFSNHLILGLGVAAGGLYDYQNRRIQRSVNLGKMWDNLEIVRLLEAEFSLPIRVENNAKACALAEYWLMQKEEIADLAWIHLGEGISAGLIQKGEWVRGRSNYSGELGHISLVSDGELCNCGNQGCLEAYWGWKGIKNRLHKEGFFEKSKVNMQAFRMKDWQKFLETESDLGRQMSGEMSRDVGKVASQLINLLNPSHIFLGGPTVQTLRNSLGSLLEVVQKEAFPEVARETAISISQMTSYAGSLGGCALILREVFQNPESEIFGLLEGEPIRE